jgi:hypothetical protein
MALTIGPVGHGERRPLLVVHGIGLLVGSTTTALVLMLVGVALRPVVPEGDPARLAALVVAVAWAFNLLTGHGPGFPASHWQVPEQWRHQLPPMFTVFAYGVLLGAGVLTNPVVPLIWVLVALSALLPPSPWIVLAWVLYAATRWGTTLRATKHVNRAGDPGTSNPRPAGLGVVRLASAAVLAALGIALISS